MISVHAYRDYGDYGSYSGYDGYGGYGVYGGYVTFRFGMSRNFHLNFCPVLQKFIALQNCAASSLQSVEFGHRCHENSSLKFFASLSKVARLPFQAAMSATSANC